ATPGFRFPQNHHLQCRAVSPAVSLHSQCQNGYGDECGGPLEAPEGDHGKGHECQQERPRRAKQISA
ncbi:hypothetical protein, partial [Salipiger sp. PrR007]|uniref:hypothetical protein n=1 Tax=Salipiger sp. PrR007 TaxID=2706884 RepID=UPI0019441738